MWLLGLVNCTVVVVVCAFCVFVFGFVCAGLIWLVVLFGM